MESKYLRMACAAIVLLAIYGLYDWYRVAALNKQALSFMSEGEEWQWHDFDNGIQITFDEQRNHSILREVLIKEKLAILAFKSDNYTLTGIAIFQSDCSPNSVIPVGEKAGNGNALELRCTESGSSVYTTASWPEPNNAIKWEFDYGGFYSYVDFSKWDFSILDRELTVLNAKSR